MMTNEDRASFSKRLRGLLGYSICILLCTGVHGVHTWAAEPPGRTLQFTRKHLFVNPYESCAVADLNRDNHLDIVYGAYWFAGPDFVPQAFRPNHVSTEYMRANSDHI